MSPSYILAVLGWKVLEVIDLAVIVDNASGLRWPSACSAIMPRKLYFVNVWWKSIGILDRPFGRHVTSDRL